MQQMARRDFLNLAPLGVAAWPLMAGLAQTTPEGANAPPDPAKKRLKVGLVGCGGRGSWISNLFKAHGGFEFVAVADYFPERATRCGAQLGVAAERCYSGLDGYRRLIDAGVEAVVLQTPPYFFAQHAEYAVAAGVHVYMAKPVAVDVPGCLRIGALAQQARPRGVVVHSDYQLPRDPVNIEVTKRIQAGALGKLQMLFSSGWAGGNGYQDPANLAQPAERLKDLVWCNDVPLGGDYIVHYDIHIIDAVVWALNQTPVAAVGMATALRPSVHGDAQDSVNVLYSFADGLIWSHQGILGAYHDWLKMGRLTASLQGTQGTACLSYAGKSYVRGGPRHFNGGVPNPEASVRINIADFYTAIEQSTPDNPQIERAVQSNLTAILGREAARRRRYLTLEELLAENRVLTPELTTLQR